MTKLIEPKKYTKTLDLLRSFFLSRGFLEVHTQNRLSILAACEDPETVATYEYNGEVWPLPQTGQMWLEYELLRILMCLVSFVYRLHIDKNQIQLLVDTK